MPDPPQMACHQPNPATAAMGMAFPAMVLEAPAYTLLRPSLRSLELIDGQAAGAVYAKMGEVGAQRVVSMDAINGFYMVAGNKAGTRFIMEVRGNLGGWAQGEILKFVEKVTGEIAVETPTLEALDVFIYDYGSQGGASIPLHLELTYKAMEETVH